MKRAIAVGLLLAASLTVKAQYYETGVEPFSVKWRQVSDGKIRLIYPSTAEAFAPKYLGLLSVTDSITGIDYGIGQSKIDIVLHNHSVLANGFVAWAPRRMELIAHPSYSGYAQPWHKQLATHEMRHVKQLYSLNRHTVKFASFLIGQQATGMAAGFVPLWFLEGDAVATETALSNTGRGRSAHFYQHYRAHFLSNTPNYKYDKWLLGSYKDFIPNHYNFGYQIVAYGNLKYGNSMWAKTLNYVARNPFSLFPFYFGLKRQTGLSRKSLATKAFAFSDSIWRSGSNLQSASTIEPIIHQQKQYTNYTYPYPVNDSTVVAYKTSLRNIAAFVTIDLKNQKQQTVTLPGVLLGRPYINDSLIIWAEYKPHTRWEYKSYGQIVKYNLETKQRNVFNPRKMLGNPIYDHINKKIICIEYSDSGYFSLASINANGKYQHEYRFPSNLEPFELAMDSKNGRLYIAVVSELGKEVVTLTPQYELKRVMEPTYNNINSITVKGDSLLFAASANQCENIFYHNIHLNKTYQIVNSRYGANYPTLQHDGTIMFSGYTPNGYTLFSSNWNISNTETNIKTLNNDTLTIGLSNAARINVDTLKIQEKVYTSKRYSGIGTLLNFHSWAPVYFDPFKMSESGTTVQRGATVISQNLTGTTTFTLGYGYGTDHLFKVNLRYSGLWPVFTASYELTDEYAYLFKVNQTLNTPTSKRTKAKLYTYLPFTLGGSSYSTYFQLFNSIEYTNDYLFDKSEGKYQSGLLQMNSGAFFYALRNQSHRDMLPRLGTTITAMRVNAPANTDNLGSLLMLNAKLYLPGILPNHHLKLEGSAQRQSLKKFYFSNKVNAPRGYSLYQSEEFVGVSADYLFPLAYPDWAIGSLTYIKRLSLNLFYDYAENTYPTNVNGQIVNRNEYLQSTGIEINMDVHFLRMRYPFRLKYRQAFTGSTFETNSSFSVVYDIYSNTSKSLKNREL